MQSQRIINHNTVSVEQDIRAGATVRRRTEFMRESI